MGAMTGIAIVGILLLVAGFAGLAGSGFLLLLGRPGWDFLTPLVIALAAFFGWAVLNGLERISRLLVAQLDQGRTTQTQPGANKPIPTVSFPDYGAD